jgi:hypothetical protein
MIILESEAIGMVTCPKFAIAAPDVFWQSEIPHQAGPILIF